MKKTIIITVVVVLLAAAGLLLVFYKKSKPGIGKPYACKRTGKEPFGKDDFIFGNNYKARGAVCDYGFYIPEGSNILNQDTTAVLEWMYEIYQSKGTPTEWKEVTNLLASNTVANMKALAEAAAYQASLS